MEDENKLEDIKKLEEFLENEITVDSKNIYILSLLRNNFKRLNNMINNNIVEELDDDIEFYEKEKEKNEHRLALTRLIMMISQ